MSLPTESTTHCCHHVQLLPSGGAGAACGTLEFVTVNAYDKPFHIPTSELFGTPILYGEKFCEIAHEWMFLVSGT